MNNFDLRNFLIENKLTRNSQQLDEDLKSSVAAVMLLIGSLGAQAQIKPEYKAQIDSIQKVKTLTPQEKRAEIQKIIQLNRDDIKGKNDEVKQRAINSFLNFQRKDLIGAPPEKILKAYTAWSKERSKGDAQPCGDLNIKGANKRGKNTGSCSTGETNRGESLKDND